MPHEQAHGPMAFIKEPGMTVANVLNSGTLKNIMPLIMHWVSTEMHARVHAYLAYLNRQACGVGTESESKNQNKWRMLLLPKGK